MKAIAYRGAQLLQMLDMETLDTSKLFKLHRPLLLLPGIKIVFEGIGWTWDTEIPGARNLDEFAKLICGIEEIDPESYCFRYPINTKGQAALNHHTIINVVEFSRNMDPILDLLEAAALGLHEEFDTTAEAKFELQKILG